MPVEKKIDSFQLKEINKERLYNFLKEMEFNRLLSQAISFYGEPKLANTTNKKNKVNLTKEKIDKNQYQCVETLSELEKIIKNCENEKIISIDTETTSIHPLEANLIGISLSTGKNKSYYIPLGHTKGKNLPFNESLKKSMGVK